jgi:hypothetical protein
MRRMCFVVIAGLTLTAARGIAQQATAGLY